MSTQYIHFTEQQKQQARQTDIAELLRSQGETLKRSGSEYEWKDGSKKVTIRGNLWFHQYEQIGGDAIDFVKRFYMKSYPEAMSYLLGDCDGRLVTAPSVKKLSKPFKLPLKNDNMRRVYAYLANHRGIDKDVISTFVRKGMIYESADYHNAVFVGFDENGIARHAHKRGSGSTYKGNQSGSLPGYSFHWCGQTESASKLYLFEAPIDMLSFISMHKYNWRNHSYAAACGVSDTVLWQMIKSDSDIETVYLCRDNDEAGQTANRRTAEALLLKNIKHEILVPNRKDWNEDLIYFKQQEESQCREILLC